MSSRIVYQDLLRLITHYNQNATYSSQFKCKVILSLEVKHVFMPGLNFMDRKFYVGLWEYMKVKQNVYKKVCLAMRIFDRMESAYLFIEKAVMNNNSFSGIEVYGAKTKEE